MNKKILEKKLEYLRAKYDISRDHIECQILSAQIELLETILEAWA